MCEMCHILSMTLQMDNLLILGNIVRHPHESAEQIQLLEEMPQNKLYPVLDSINSVSATPWIINKEVCFNSLDK